jgi:hypothetical protein
MYALSADGHSYKNCRQLASQTGSSFHDVHKGSRGGRDCMLYCWTSKDVIVVFWAACFLPIGA